ncbi:DUF1778 domain-containing protein [bacterium]|nr:DUF1778 domain-containing protein [bacterium]
MTREQKGKAAASPPKKKSAARDITINLRANRRQRDLIDKAAETLNKTRSEFMLDAACGQAEGVLAERVNFTLDAKRFKEFVARLDEPAKDNPKLRRLLHKKAIWEK